MAKPKRSAAAQFHVDCTLETITSFNAIHEALHFKTKAQTFEVLIYTAAHKDNLDPHLLERIERKLDRALERQDDTM